MLLAVLALPVVLVLAVGLPLSLLMALLGTTAGPAASVVQAFGLMTMIAAMLYFMARLLPLPSILLNGQVPPLPVTWQLSQARRAAPVSALAVVFICNITVVLLIVALANLLDALGLAGAALWVLPLTLAAGFFSLGWLVLLGQRLYDYLRGGQHAGWHHQ